MSLANGTRLGPYEIVGPIGAGGMGEVYRARDTRLGRTVAVKILPAEFANDAKFKIRFEREAKAISALNHPNICTLFDVGDSYLVMEYCEGQTLAHRLAGGALGMEEAIAYGIQIAEALHKAHRSGIVHRDLKPGNVMITKGGVKLLDFGLAALDGESSITIDRHIVGTLPYMAPETLDGRQADARTDIYALGLVLYEMVTGKRASSSTEPVPDPALARLIRACLARDPDDRIQSAGDVAIELRWMREASDAPRQPRARGAWVAWSVAVIAAALAIWIALARPSAPPPASVTRATIDLRNAPPLALGRYATTVGFFSPLLALSHDGTRLVYVGVVDGGTQLFMRRLDSFDVKPIEGTRGAYHAFFSPDDRWLAFFANEKIMKVPAEGGTPITLSNIVAAVRGVWTGNGTMVITEQQGLTLREIPENGGSGTAIDPPTSAGFLSRFSALLPDGSVVLGSRERIGGDFAASVIFDRQTHRVFPLLDRAYDVRPAGKTRLTFVRGGDLYSIAFDPKTRKTVGEAVVLQHGVAMDSFFRQAQYAVSDTGTVAFVPGADRAFGKLSWVDATGRSQFLPYPKRAYTVFSVSPDEQKIAAGVADVDDFISVLDTHNGVEKRLPLPSQARFPVWMGDSKTLVYATQTAIEVSDVAGNHRVIVDSEFTIPSVSADGRTLVAQRRRTVENPATIVQLGPKPQMHSINNGRCVCDMSPDGRWVAYLSDRSGTDEVWVSPVADPQRAEQVSVGGGVEPRFCAACPDLFYRHGTQWYAVRRGPAGEWQAPRPVFQTEFVDTVGRSYDVTPDGKRLLISKADPDITDRIGVLEHAFDR